MLTTDPPVSLVSLPPEILEHHIFNFLSWCDLTPCSLASALLRKIYLRRYGRSGVINSEQHQRKILEDIYGGGSLSLLGWFEAVLWFPKFASLDSRLADNCLMRAAAGNAYKYTFNFANVLFNIHSNY